MPTVIQPLADRVVVRPVAAAEQSKGGIIIPDVAKEKPQEGLVVAVGPGRVDGGVLVPCRCKVGDRVLHGHFSGVEVTLDEVPHLILRETDVLAILITQHSQVHLHCSRCTGEYIGSTQYANAACMCGAPWRESEFMSYDEINRQRRAGVAIDTFRDDDRLPGVDATASDEADDTASPFIGY
jgi:chaperonin GroES